MALQQMPVNYDVWMQKLNRKIESKPMPVKTLQRRTMNSAIAICNCLSGLDFSKISMSLYFYCKDVQMQQFTHLYESQIELAGANPEKFAFQLHQFYNNISTKIKKNDWYDDFFEFYYRCIRVRIENSGEKMEDRVLVAYLNLLTQNLEYLRPSKFDFSVCVAGRKTTGELMIDKDPFPDVDQATYDFRAAYENEKKQPDIPAQLFLSQCYQKYGYEVHSMLDLDILTNKDKIQSTTTAVLLPFINEYTFDIRPQNPFVPQILEFESFHTSIDIDQVKNDLQKRNRTLPTNGVKVTFENNSLFDKLLLKEVLYDDRIFLLYRLRTRTKGDLSGVYDTKEKFFYSILSDYKEDPNLVNKIASLILFCYACSVKNDSNYSLENISKLFLVNKQPLSAMMYMHGGKLRNVYDREGEEHRTGTARIGNEDYETNQKNIQGFIRRLPEGQQASEQAILYAESMGYQLETNETFVRPFVKQVFKLRKK